MTPIPHKASLPRLTVARWRRLYAIIEKMPLFDEAVVNEEGEVSADVEGEILKGTRSR